MAGKNDAAALQRKIFSRWVTQKLSAKGLKIEDCVDGFKEGELLIKLIEILAEKEFPDWKKVKTGSRLNNIDACSQALKFVFANGVEMKMKPSPENLVDGEERSNMGMVWAIMLKFMRLDDDEEDEGKKMTFQDALKMWIQNQVQSYGIEVANWTKAFHDGKIFCALINKFRPKLLDYAGQAANGSPEANLQLAFDAAEKYFGLEKYLSVDDISKLDDKSMVVYASEFYYGIAAQRRVDLAAKRVVKLVDWTKENDRIKADFGVRSGALKGRFEKVLAVLSDTTIENTMAGAVRRLALFNDYRKQDKSYLFGESFFLDGEFSNLARRLVSHKRPAYVPEAGCSVPEIMANLKDVEAKEASQNVALHQELNRQIKLAKIYEQYQGKNAELTSWIATQRAYLEKKLEILSVGAAKFALNQLDAYFVAYAAVNATIPQFNSWAKELLDNTFEFSSTVSQIQDTIAAGLQDLVAKSAQKKLVHEDDLAREIVKARVRGWNDDHVADYGKLEKFINAAAAALAVKEKVDSIKDAELHLGLTRAINDERAALTVNIAPLQKVGADILGTEYKSDLSQWKFEFPEQVQAREKFVTDGFANLEAVGNEKILVLEDDLARENYREMVRQWNENHKLQFKNLEAWIAKSKAYVDKKEPCDSVENAEDNLVVHRAYMANEKAMLENDVVTLQKQGQAILEAKYETKYSRFVFATPEEVKDREASVQASFTYLGATAATKLEILEDDLAREQFRFKVKKWNEQHVRQHTGLEAWIATSKVYVETKEPVNSVEQAQDNLVVIRAYLGSQTLMQSGDVKALQALGQQILTAVYETKWSRWVFPTPEEVVSREKFVTDSFDYLVNTSDQKRLVLEDDLAREQFKFKLRLWNDQHKDQHSKLEAWINVQVAYLAVVEPFDSIADAEKNLKVLAAYVADKEDVTKINVASFNKRGKEILDAEYKTSLSQWKWETPEEVQGRLDYVSTSWSSLDSSAAAKRAKLDADLAKEIRKEELRVEWAKVTAEFEGISRDTCTSAPNTMFGFVLEEVEAFAATLQALDDGLNASAAKAKAQYDPVWAEMISLGVRTPENPYSSLTPDDLARMQADLASAIASRKARFDAELEKQRADDKACRELAAAVDPFCAAITTNKAVVTEAKDELQGQLDTLNRVAGEPKGEALPNIQALQEVVDGRNIIYNRHTLNNGSDATVQFKQYTDYMTTKRKMLEDEIEYLALRGLTKEQYAEMKGQFDQFDKDKSGFLDKREFRSCLYSMGEERGKKEIEAILSKLGNGDPNNIKIAYDGFKEFMIEQLGDTDTEEEITKGLRLVNRQEERCNWALMGDVLDKPYTDYIQATHGDDYAAWATSMFAR